MPVILYWHCIMYTALLHNMMQKLWFMKYNVLDYSLLANQNVQMNNV